MPLACEDYQSIIGGNNMMCEDYQSNKGVTASVTGTIRAIQAILEQSLSHPEVRV